MLRSAVPAQFSRELQRMLELNEARGTPYLQGYYRRIQDGGWFTRNTQILHLYEIFDHLKGYCCIIPLTKPAYADFRGGRRFPWRDLSAEDILSERDYQEALEASIPLAVWVESFTYADEHAYHVVGQHLLDHLRRLNLYGLVAESSCPQSEEDCRFLGLVEVRAYDKCPTGTRRLWRADEGSIQHPSWPFGPPYQSLELEEAERRVAQLYYGAWNKQGPLTEHQVAKELLRSVNTVKSQLASIRAKADRVIGTCDRDRISLWLHLHPSECALPASDRATVHPRGEPRLPASTLQITVSAWRAVTPFAGRLPIGHSPLRNVVSVGAALAAIPRRHPRCGESRSVHCCCSVRA